MMRILHVIPSVSPKRGGPSFALHTMAEAVASCGADIHIVTTNDDGEGRLTVPLEEPILEKNITVRYFRRQLRFYTISWPLTRWLWQHVPEYDLLHIHSLFSFSTLSAAWIAHWYGIPYIIRPLGHLNRWGIQNRRALLKRLSLHWIERPLLQWATLLHFTCEQERLEAEEIGVVGPSVIVPLGIDIAPFQQLLPIDDFLANYPQAPAKVRILFLSRIDPKKGLDLLLAAFAQVQRSRPDTVLVIAGDGDSLYLAKLKVLAQQLNITDSIIWTGFLTGQAKLAALAAADIFTLPSYSENFGIAVVEAMSAGLPVVVTDQVGIHREISNAKAGLVIACKVDELIFALHRLIASSTQRRELGDNGKRLTEELFSQTAMTHRLLTMYEQVLSTKMRTENVASMPVSETSRH